MRASSWASTTTRRARSVNRSNMLIAPESSWSGSPHGPPGYRVYNPTHSVRVPAAGDVEPVGTRPVADLTGTRPEVGRAARALAAAAAGAADGATGPDVLRERVAQLAGVLVVQVDLVGLP